MIGLIWSVLAHVRGMESYCFEDAFITFRYAQNLADGLGFVFNSGERVLGTSTPLFTLILALAARLGADIASFGAWLYVASLASAGGVGAWFLRRRGFANAGAVFALLTVLAAGESLAYFGMETTFHLLLMLAAMLAADFDKPILTGVVLGLLCLNRYDGVLPAVAVGCYLWSVRRRPPWLETLIALAFFGSWLVFAYGYFGSIFPNTLGAKAGDSDVLAYLATTLEFQTSMLLSPIKEYLGALSRSTESLLSLLFFLPSLVLSPVLIKRRPPLGMLVGSAVLLLLGYALIGPPPRHQWYHLPSLFCLSAFAFAGWGYGVELAAELAAERRKGRLGFSAQAATTWLCLALVIGVLVELPERTDARCRYYGGMRIQDKVSAYSNFARYISEHALGNTSVLTHEPGFLTFKTGQLAIDAVGLVSPNIYYHGPKGRRTGWNSLVERYRPDFAVLSSPGGRPQAEIFERFIPVVVAPPHYWLIMDRDVFTRRLPALFQHWTKPRAGLEPSDVGRFGRPAKDQLRSLTEGWTIRGQPLDNEPGTGFAWSREFLVDFDELVLDFAGSSSETMMQLLVEGGLVLEVNGSSPIVDPQRRGIPIYPWRGRRAQIRVVDRDPGGSIQIEGLKPRTYGNARIVDDFEAESLGPFWQPESSPMLVSTESLAPRFGLQAVQGLGAAGSLELEGRQSFRSRELILEDDRWMMAIFDAGSSATGVSLWVDGERVLTWQGRGTGRVHMLKWDLRDWKGRRGVFEIYDRDPDPGVGIAVDSIAALQLRH